MSGTCGCLGVCECHKTSAAGAVSDIGSGIVRGVFTVIGGCFAVTLVVGVVRMVLPLLAAGLAVVFAAVCVTAVTVTVRRRLRRRRPVVLAPEPDLELTSQVRAAMAEGLVDLALEPGRRDAVLPARVTRRVSSRHE